jgi:Cu-Zn family superoxide dismutase
MADAGAVPAGGAGSHWNPASMKHGVINTDGGMHHAGDLGNITVAADGTGTRMLTTTEWTISDLAGLSVILHANADDLMTDPTGASGARIACGVITMP